jgi:hypothetical protein
MIWRNIKLLPLLASVSTGLVLATLVGCGEDVETAPPTDEYGIGNGSVDEWGKPTLGDSGWAEPGGKEDAIRGAAGLPVSADNQSTSVWEVRNAWDDTDTEEAHKAGIAWVENSGLTWDQKYSKWVASLEKAPVVGGWGDAETFKIVTPYGKVVPSPVLECAEVAMFMRVTFASWYNLPWYMAGRDGEGTMMYFGHFGVRSPTGRYKNTPNYRDAYTDYSSQAEAVRNGATWPSDPTLHSRGLVGAYDDQQPAIGPDARLGAYFDELLLNKRVGYFLMLQLVYFGSVNLADSSNLYNIKPEAIQPGDVLLERWQKQGIGHTLVILRRRDLGTITTAAGEELPQLEAELASGSMPRRQPDWDNPASTKRYLTLEETGGGEYAEFGGGIKRWRTAKSVDGKWTNVVSSASVGDWVSTRATAEIAARPERFELILSELAPQDKMEVLVSIIEAKREHLQHYPASCSARINREHVFKDLYETAADPAVGLTAEDVDRSYRKIDDYIFAELDYGVSKTCCWNSSTSAMYDIIVQYNMEHIVDATTGTCNEVTVFKNRDDSGDGYQLFADYAAEIGRGAEWVKWSEDEPCSQRGVKEDTEVEHAWQPLCSIYEDISAP